MARCEALKSLNTHNLVRPQQTFTFVAQAEKEENLVSKVKQRDNNVKELKDEVIMEEGKEEKSQHKNTAKPSPRLFLRSFVKRLSSEQFL